MSLFKRIFGSAAVVLGFVGAILCASLMVAVFFVNVRVRATTRSAYSDIDELFSQASSGLAQMDDAFDEAKITTTEVKDSITEWTRQATEDRLIEETIQRIRDNPSTDQLAASLSKADGLIFASAQSVSFLIVISNTANQAGARIDLEALASLQAEIIELQSKLRDVVDLASDLSRLGESGAPNDLRERLTRAAELTVKVLATLGTIQEALNELEAEVRSLQQRVVDSEPTLVNWINVVTLVVAFLCFWMFAGQCALGSEGWSLARGSRALG